MAVQQSKINQYVKFKLKDEYLPDFITELRNDGKILNASIVEQSEIFYINRQYLRLLKIKNLGNNISERDKEILDFLLDNRFTVFITEEEYKFMLKVSTYTTTFPYNAILTPKKRYKTTNVNGNTIITGYI